MLQQTRVETVSAYWSRFLERFPSVEALAAAQEEAVRAAWSGLGYYSRARALRRAAAAIVERHGGQFPRERAAALALPGVGEYTAGAVLSIAYELPEALVDGNVERVFARLFGLELVRSSGALKRRSWELARELLPRRAAGEWNQSLMELGATICTPTRPRCDDCPLGSGCRARREGRTQELPLAPKRRPPVELALEIAVLRRGAQLLLERRPEGGRMAGMWQFPTRQLSTSEGLGGEAVFPASWAGWPAARADAAALATLGEIRHSITRFRIRARVLELEAALAHGAGTPGAALEWIERESLGTRPLTGMTKKVLTMLIEG